MDRISRRRLPLVLGLLAVAGLLVIATPTALADLMPAPNLFDGNPVQFNSIEQPMPMSYSEDALNDSNHMVLPQSMLQGYVTQPPPTDAEEEASRGSLLGGGSLRMVLAGLLLSAAAVTLGLVLQRRAAAKAVVASLLLGAGLVAAIEYSAEQQVIANAGPLPVDESIYREKPDTQAQVAEEIVEAIEAGETLTIEFAEEGNVIQFIRGTKPKP